MSGPARVSAWSRIALAQGGDAEQLWNLVEGAAVDWQRADAPKGRALISRRASEIEPEPIEWL